MMNILNEIRLIEPMLVRSIFDNLCICDLVCLSLVSTTMQTFIFKHYDIVLLKKLYRPSHWNYIIPNWFRNNNIGRYYKNFGSTFLYITELYKPWSEIHKLIRKEDNEYGSGYFYTWLFEKNSHCNCEYVTCLWGKYPTMSFDKYDKNDN